MASLLELARSIQTEGNLPGDPTAAAAEITRALALERPESTTRARQRAAAQAVGIEAPPTSAQANRILEETSPRARARGVTKRAGKAARKPRRALGRLGRELTPARAIKGATTTRGVVTQAFALVVLYWLLRTASRSQGEEFLTRVVSGLRRPFEWLFSSRGVAAGATATTGGASGAVSTGGDRKGRGGEASPSAAVDRWRPLVEYWFPPGEVEKALRVIWCESRGNPDAVNPASTQASGLFQHLPEFWPQRSQAAGFPGSSIFNPTANVGVAAWLVNRDGWGHWPNCGKL